MKTFILAIALVALTGCSALSDTTPHRRNIEPCTNCYYYGSGAPDPIKQPMWR